MAYSLTKVSSINIMFSMSNKGGLENELSGKVFEFQGNEDHPWNKRQSRVVSRPDGGLVDPVNNLAWGKGGFEDELSRGLWTEVKLNGLTKQEKALAVRQYLTDAGIINANSLQVQAAETYINQYPNIGMGLVGEALMQKLEGQRG